jgi:hypothetical protein
MTQISSTVSYRVATRDDETDVLAVLEDVAPEIPVRLDGPERQERIQTIIQQCHRSGKSWVAVDANGKVIGFLLARPDAREGRAAISVQYVGVTVGSRRRGVFSTLIEKLKANGVPLIATVLHNNQSSMADRLVKNGFAKTESNAKQTQFLWSPR